MYFVVVILPLLCKLAAANEPHPLSDEFIDLINNEGKWKAGRNFHRDTSLEYIKQLSGANIGDVKSFPTIEHDAEFIKDLPESFDARDQWPKCPSLKEIRDQGECGCCWAIAAVAAMTDRVCIYSNGTKNFHFSVEDLISCAGYDGCHGGYPENAWSYWIKTGLVSGGNYNSNQGCKPYSIPECEHHMKNCTHYQPTPRCNCTCRDGYDVAYKDDKRHGKTGYDIFGEDNIMAELFKNGPLEATFAVYSDFAAYKDGVYQHIQGEMLGYHAVKIIGWGVEDGKKYWLIANSWGTGFGDKGFFKILRGVDECEIESSIVGGEPLLEEY